MPNLDSTDRPRRGNKTRRLLPRGSIWVRFLSLVILVVLLTGGITGFTLINLSRETLRQEALDKNFVRAELIAGFTSNYMRAVKAHVIVFADRPDVHQAVLSGRPETLLATLANFVRIQTALETSGLYSNQGVQLASSDTGATTVGQSFADREWFQEVIATGRSYQGTPVISRVTGNPIIPFAVPILDERGQIQAVVAGGISLSRLYASVVNVASDEGAHISMIDYRNGGIVLADTNPQHVMKPVAEHLEVFSRLLAGETGTVEDLHSTEGVQGLTAFAQVAETPWGIIISTPSANALALGNILTRNSVLFTALIVIIAVVLGFILTLSITKPLRRLVTGAKIIGSGNLDYAVATSVNDEVGDLARAIGEMAQNLKQTLVSRNELIVEIAERKKAEERVSRLNQILRAVRNVNQLITHTSNRQELLAKACQNLVATHGYEKCWITALDTSSKVIAISEVNWGISFVPMQEQLIKGTLPKCVNEAIKLGKARLVTEEERNALCSDCLLQTEHHPNSSIVAPMNFAGRIMGLLVARVPEKITLDEEEIGLFQEMADDIAFALRNLELESERRKALHELEASETRYRRLFEAAKDGILILDAESGFIIDVNPFLVEMLGYSKSELLGKELWQIGVFKDIVSSQVAFSILQQSSYMRYEDLPLVTRDGRKCEVEFVSNVYPVDNHKIIQCNIRDITERKKAEAKLKESEEFSQLILSHSPTPIILQNPDTSIRYVNPSFEKLIAYSSSEILEKKAPYPYWVPEKVDQYLADMRKHFPTVSNFSGTREFVKKTGERIWVNLSDQAVIDSTGQLKYRISNYIDITDRLKAEEERQKSAKLESVGTLAGGIAHDFNNILTGILGNIQLAGGYLQQNKGETAREMLVEAEKASLRARDLIKQLLTFSKGGAPVKKVLLVGNLVRDAAIFALRGSRVKPEFAIAGNLWAVEADEGQINQVIHNLVINADQAMPNGGIIKVRAGNIAVGAEATLPLTEGNYIEIAVEDQGLGIPESHFSRIFEPYFTTKQRGSGLGLATSYSIIRNHGGVITFESKAGSGTTFHIYLPATRKKAEKEREEVAAAPLPAGRGRILVMDDEETIRVLLDRTLRSAGYEVETAGEGNEAIQKYTGAREAGKPFAAVVLDLTVPGGMGGREVIEKLREIDPAIKAIVSSGYANDPIMADYQQYGFSGVVTKPYNVEEMKKTLHRILMRKKTN